MEYILSVIMLLLCMTCIRGMFVAQGGGGHILGIISLFSIGYYVLPVFFKELSGLDAIDDQDLISVSTMTSAFFLAIILGYNIFVKVFGSRYTTGLHFANLDWLVVDHKLPIFFFSYLLWLGYFFNSPATSYASEDFDAFFLEKNAFDGLLSSLSGYALAAMAVILSLEIVAKNRRYMLFMSVAYASCVFLLLTTAQRLAVISPIFTFVAALSVLGAARLSAKLIFAGIAFLVAISPLMVFLREFQAGQLSGTDKALVASGQFSYAPESLFDGLLLSIMQRADLLEVSSYLKSYIDASGHAGSSYFSSVLFSFVPRFMDGSKPYPLSDDGTLYGSISVIAWNLLQGLSLGSLSAFGAISAYWEGGWLWMPVNGLLTGFLFGLIFCLLGRGGLVSKLLYSSVFVTICIKNVPPSLFELVVYTAPTINLLIVLWLCSKVLLWLRRESPRAGSKD